MKVFLHDNKKTYVLIHGAWHGGWCWKFISNILTKMGHNVLTPDLPGHGSNKADFKSVSLQVYVDYVIDLINSCDTPVVLVGHSMAGVVITQVAQHRADKIDCLVYVSAFIPQNNSSLTQEAQQSSSAEFGSMLGINVDEMTISINSQEKAVHAFYNTCDEESIQFALDHIQKQPLSPFSDKVTISQDLLAPIKKIYIQCLQDNAIPLADQKRMYERTNCKVETLDCDHSPFLSAPDELADILCNL
jgi:pimeloyl-ACP methyl ester carboxylesterase